VSEGQAVPAQQVGGTCHRQEETWIPHRLASYSRETSPLAEENQEGKWLQTALFRLLTVAQERLGTQSRISDLLCWVLYRQRTFHREPTIRLSDRPQQVDKTDRQAGRMREN
ncbi:hypothetical protein KIL84_009415, partial [Mauremys mutica]